MTDFDLRNQQVGTQYIAARDINIASDTGATIEHRRNRSIMLDTIQVCWITSVLDKSLYSAAPIVLSLQEQPDAVETPWKDSLYPSNIPVHPLLSSTHITDIYDYADRKLLILGESGSGKTRLLLELTRALLDRARQDENHPMPVIFNLSTWTVKQQRLSDWLVDELNNTYHVSPKLGQMWIDHDLVLPLLDGLDRVPQKYRAKCINAINTYRRNHGLLPTVVCSQSSSYLNEETRLLLNNAIVVQPLTLSQIDGYLASVEENSTMLRSAILADPTLQELAATPLMLTILPLVCQEGSAQALLTANSASELRRYMLTTFVKRMLRGSRSTAPFTSEQISRWLTWLAWQMSHHNQTAFYTERLQPDWLVGSKFRKFYRSAIKLFVGLLCGVIIGQVTLLAYGINFGLTDGLLTGSIVGLLGGVLFGLMADQPMFQMLFYKPTIKSETGKIRPVEVVVWSWVSMFRGLFNGQTLRKCAVIGIISELIFITLFGSNFGVSMALALTGSSLLIIGLQSGLSNKKLKKRKFLNQGIWYSARNSIFVGLLTGFIRGSFGVLLFSRLGGFWGLDIGIAAGVSFGLMAGLSSGGLAYIQHFVLRELLFLTGYIP